MTHKEFLNELQKSCHADHHQCASLLNALIKLMAQAAIDQIPVTIPGLGTFNSHKHPEYIQEDHLTGQQTLYPPRISYRMQPYNPQTDHEEGSIEQELAEYANLDVEVTDKFIRSLADTVVNHLHKHDEVEIHGLGLFHIIETHQTQLHRIAYTPDEQMREMVNAPFNCFEPVVITKGRIAETSIPVEDERTEEDETSECITSATTTDANTTEEEVIAEITENEAPQDENKLFEEKQNINDEVNEPQAETNEKTELKAEIVEEEGETLILQQARKPFPWRRLLMYASIVLVILFCSTFVIYLIKSKPAPPPVLADIEQKTIADKRESRKPMTVAATEEETSVVDTIKLDNVTQKEDSIHQYVESRIENKQEQQLNTTKQKPLAESSEVKQPVTEIKAVPKTEKAVKQETKPLAQQGPKEFHRKLDADGQPITVTLNPGERLTIVALNEYGDKAFWPYVFEVNSDRLKAPNLVQAGMKLYLPDPAFYHIDVNDPESLRKAKNKGAQLLNNMN